MKKKKEEIQFIRSGWEDLAQALNQANRDDFWETILEKAGLLDK